MALFLSNNLSTIPHAFPARRLPATCRLRPPRARADRLDVDATASLEIALVHLVKIEWEQSFEEALSRRADGWGCSTCPPSL